MKEDFLQQIWKMKRFPMNQLRLTDGRELSVLKTGIHNKESGPDFFNGEIIIDGIRWCGNIEIHVKSSDWNSHGHQFDKTYNNVILHVVYENNQPIVIEGEEIPCLELKQFLVQKMWSSYETFLLNSNWIPCENLLSKVDQVYFYKQLENSLINRLERKVNKLNLRLNELQNNYRQLMYEVFAESFGNKVNSFPFIELTQRISINILEKENEQNKKDLLLGVAGLLNSSKNENWTFLKEKYKLSQMDSASWKYKGLRPKGFPEKRVEQFTSFLSHEKSFSIWNNSPTEILNFFKQFNKILSEKFQELIIINAIVPIIWFWSEQRKEPDLKNKALHVLEMLKPESNQIVEKWKKNKIYPKNACESQGLLELKNELCDKRKCLECMIGTKILTQ
jgi:hypothetical protein